MAFIETPETHRFPWYVRLFLWHQRRRYGAELEPARLWGRSPLVFCAVALLYGALDRRNSPLEPSLRVPGGCPRIERPTAESPFWP